VETRGSIRPPLAAALDAELRRLDQRVTQAFCMLFAAGVVGSVAVAVTFSRSLGIACAVANLLLALPFASAARSLATRPLSRIAALGLATTEAALPWLFLGVLIFTQGAAYALASWLPPMVFAGVMVAGVARLRPVVPIVIGVLGAVSHLLLYVVLAAPRLGGEPALFVQPPIQISRAVSLVVGGLVAAFVTRELRSAIGRAESKLRGEELFGKYRLVRKVGSGAAGVVHEAVYCPEGGFERRVAVKVLHEHLASEPAFLEGFRREAELGARLAHPNVVTTHDFGRHGGIAFMAMEFVDGLTLARLLTRAAAAKVAIPIDVAAFIGRAALAGLDHAHDGVRGDDGAPLRILHRDVCPQNLLVSKLGEVKLNDFGIARVLGAAAATATRTVAGHEAYMAPEQARGEEMSLRADLFAVGAIVWELVAGRRLFARNNSAATLLAVLEDVVPPIAAVRAEVDPAWNAFFARALARDAEARFGSARAMGEELAALPDARSDDAQAKLAELMARFAEAPEKGDVVEDPSTSLPTRLS
jgi:serine/threonine-protein kinase